MKITRLTIYKTPQRWAMGKRRYHDKKAGVVRESHYPKPELQEYKRLIYAEAERQGLRPTKGPVSLAVHYFHARTGWTKQKTHGGVPVPDGPIPKLTTPDLTNLTKALEDGLTGIAYLDDRQVHAHTSEGKWFVARGGAPRIEVVITQYDETDTFVLGTDGCPRPENPPTEAGGEPHRMPHPPASSLFTAEED